jgi:hypothetical protein
MTSIFGGNFVAKMGVNKRKMMNMMNPLVNYGIYEAVEYGVRHGITEAVLIAYLMGSGYGMMDARNMVESWEVDEKFPMEKQYKYREYNN